MADKFINKVVYGGETLIDLTTDRVIRDTMLEYAVVNGEYKYYESPEEYDGDPADLAQIEIVIDDSGETQTETRWILRNSAHTASGERVYGNVRSYEGGDQSLNLEDEAGVNKLTFSIPEGYYLDGINISQELGDFTKPADDTTAAGSAQILKDHSAWVDGKLVEGAIESTNTTRIELSNNDPTDSIDAGKYVNKAIDIVARQDTATRTVVPLANEDQVISANADNENAFLKGVIVKKISYVPVDDAIGGTAIYIGCDNISVGETAPYIYLNDVIYSNAGATWADFKVNYPDLAKKWSGSGSELITTQEDVSSMALTLQDSNGTQQTWDATLVTGTHYKFEG